VSDSACFRANLLSIALRACLGAVDTRLAHAFSADVSGTFSASNFWLAYGQCQKLLSKYRPKVNGEIYCNIFLRDKKSLTS